MRGQVSSWLVSWLKNKSHSDSLRQLPAPVCCSTSKRPESILCLQIFFAAIGANGSIQQVLSTAPQLFLFSLLQIAVHLVLILAAGWALGFTRRDVLLASNANVGGEHRCGCMSVRRDPVQRNRLPAGPTTAAGMAAAKGWRTSLVPSLLVGTAGYAIATIIAVFLGVTVLQHM